MSRLHGAGVWDAHGGLKANHEANFKAVDKPVGALLKDLRTKAKITSPFDHSSPYQGAV
jgi:hypothetical protein